MVFFIRGAVRLSLGLHSLALSPSNLHNKCHWYQWKRVSAIGRRVLSFWGEWLHRQVRKYAQVSKVQSRMDAEKRQPSLLMIERPVITVGNFWETYIQRVDFGKNLIWRIKRETNRDREADDARNFSILFLSWKIALTVRKHSQLPITLRRSTRYGTERKGVWFLYFSSESWKSPLSKYWIAFTSCPTPSAIRLSAW